MSLLRFTLFDLFWMSRKSNPYYPALQITDTKHFMALTKETRILLLYQGILEHYKSRFTAFFIAYHHNEVIATCTICTDVTDLDSQLFDGCDKINSDAYNRIYADL